MNNNWDIMPSHVVFFEKMLSQHTAVADFVREKDICFVVRKLDGVTIRIVIVDRYVLGKVDLINIIDEFPDVNMVFVSGTWNHYTREAKEYGLDRQIGVYHPAEFFGALLKGNEFWNFVKKDKNGDPISYCSVS